MLRTKVCACLMLVLLISLFGMASLFSISSARESDDQGKEEGRRRPICYKKDVKGPAEPGENTVRLKGKNLCYNNAILVPNQYWYFEADRDFEEYCPTEKVITWYIKPDDFVKGTFRGKCPDGSYKFDVYVNGH